MKRSLFFLLTALCTCILQLSAQSNSNFTVEEEVRQLSALLELDRGKAAELRAISARFAARSADLDPRADRRAYRALKEEKVDLLSNLIGPDKGEQYAEWLEAGNPVFASLGGSTARSAYSQSEPSAIPGTSQPKETKPVARPEPTAAGMAETQADYMVRRLDLTEEQRTKIVDMYSRFNRDFDRQRERQEGSEISGIQQMLREQQEKKDRELKRILTEEQFQKYLELEGRGEK